MAMDRHEIHHLFERLNEELARGGVAGEVYLVGGAVMCLVHEARKSTQDIDAVFRPADVVREAAQRIAGWEGYASDWLNDAVKGFLSERGDYRPYYELSNLSVMTASPEYLLAMKCLSMRLGAEFHDEDDIRYLLRYLNITEPAAALETVARYYPLDRVPQKTIYALEEIVGG